MKRPIESDYTSHVAYTRALEAYCDSLSQDEPWTPDDMAYRPGGLAQPEQGTLMTKDEALKLALEALENAIAVRHGKDGTKFVDPLEPNAITAIKEALAQPDHIVDANKMAQPCTTCEALAEIKSWMASYKPYRNTGAVLVEEMRRTAKRIEDLEAMLERQTARIVDLQTHIENLEGEQ